VIVDNFNVERTKVRPTEADPVLIVDPNRMLASAVAFEGFETVAGRDPQIRYVV
jgi:hypothetical protein